MLRAPYLILAPLALLAAPLAAQDIAIDETQDRSLDRMAEALADPVQQQALAGSLAVVAEVLLDLPLAPILAPLTEAAGGDPGRIDRDATLRKIAPGAGAVTAEIQDKLPRAMSGMAAMSGAMARMTPVLRDMAERMRDALPATLPSLDRRQGGRD